MHGRTGRSTTIGVLLAAGLLLGAADARGAAPCAVAAAPSAPAPLSATEAAGRRGATSIALSRSGLVRLCERGRTSARLVRLGRESGERPVAFTVRGGLVALRTVRRGRAPGRVHVLRVRRAGLATRVRTVSVSDARERLAADVRLGLGPDGALVWSEGDGRARRVLLRRPGAAAVVLHRGPAGPAPVADDVLEVARGVLLVDGRRIVALDRRARPCERPGSDLLEAGDLRIGRLPALATDEAADPGDYDVVVGTYAALVVCRGDAPAFGALARVSTYASNDLYGLGSREVVTRAGLVGGAVALERTTVVDGDDGSADKIGAGPVPDVTSVETTLLDGRDGRPLGRRGGWLGAPGETAPSPATGAPGVLAGSGDRLGPRAAG